MLHWLCWVGGLDGIGVTRGHGEAMQKMENATVGESSNSLKSNAAAKIVGTIHQGQTRYGAKL